VIFVDRGTTRWSVLVERQTQGGLARRPYHSAQTKLGGGEEAVAIHCRVLAEGGGRRGDARAGMFARCITVSTPARTSTVCP
jgi:hypothetical protein